MTWAKVEFVLIFSHLFHLPNSCTLIYDDVIVGIFGFEYNRFLEEFGIIEKKVNISKIQQTNIYSMVNYLPSIFVRHQFTFVEWIEGIMDHVEFENRNGARGLMPKRFGFEIQLKPFCPVTRSIIVVFVCTYRTMIYKYNTKT